MQALKPSVVHSMETWYKNNLNYPFPTPEEVKSFIKGGDISHGQVSIKLSNILIKI